MSDRPEIPDERSPLPYFAGRDAELDAFERKLRSVCADGHCTSGVMLTTGVPSSGKSGALTLLRGDVSFGIPSFHGYMIDLLRQRERERSR